MSSILGEFVDFAADFGLEFDERNVGSKRGAIVRHYMKGDRKGTLNGWTKWHTDAMVITFGCNKAWGPDHYETWRYKDRDKSKAEIKRDWQKENEARKAKQLAEEEERLIRSDDALEIYNMEGMEQGNFDYIKRKCLPDYPYGAVFLEWSEFDLLFGGKDRAKLIEEGGAKIRYGKVMVLPVMSSQGFLNSVQVITEFKNGAGMDKYFMKGAAKGMLVVPGKDKFVFATEGYATGITINELTECKTYIGFDTSGLPAAVKAAINENPQSIIVIASDNDVRTVMKKASETGVYDEMKWNAGQKKAIEIMTSENSVMRKNRVHNMPNPDFGGKCSDWNDLVSMGVMTKHQVRNIIANFCRSI